MGGLSRGRGGRGWRSPGSGRRWLLFCCFSLLFQRTRKWGEIELGVRVCVCKSGGVWLGAIFFFLIVERENPLTRFPRGDGAVLLLFLPNVGMEWISLPASAHLLVLQSVSLPPSPSRSTSVKPPERAGCLQSGPVTCRGSCMEMLALLLSGLCFFLWQITEIPLRIPTLPLFPALKNKVYDAGSKV